MSEGASPEPIAGMNALSGQGNDVPLTKPVTVQVTSDAPGEITLTWEGADAPDGFLLMAMILETLEFEFASVPDSAARTGTVTGLTGGVSYVGVVVALKATEDGVDYLYEWGGPVTVQSSVTVESAEDRETLMAFYNAMGGANWADNTNWLSAALIGDWYGVTTDAEGNVTELNLRGNQLTGPIPTSLGNLSNLRRVNLGDNELTGTIPTQLQNLSNLEELRLWENQLTGPIPTSLGNLSNLTYLHLGDNELTGPIPTSLGNLSNLTYLHLGGNELTGTIPTQLQNLSNLEELRLWENQLTGPIPTCSGTSLT